MCVCALESHCASVSGAAHPTSVSASVTASGTTGISDFYTTTMANSLRFKQWHTHQVRFSYIDSFESTVDLTTID